MKVILSTALALALLARLTLDAAPPLPAQKVVAAEDFESASETQFEAYCFVPKDGSLDRVSAPERVSAKLVPVSKPGEANANSKLLHALELKGDFPSDAFAEGALGLLGVTFKPKIQPSGNNKDTELGAYMFSCDVALIDGEPIRDLQVNVIGTDTNTGGLLSLDLHDAVVGGGYVHVAVSLDQQRELFGYADHPFAPSSSAYQLQFQINSFSFVEAAERTPKKVTVDIQNIKIEHIR